MNNNKQKASNFWCMVSIPLRRGDRHIPKYQILDSKYTPIYTKDTKLCFQFLLLLGIIEHPAYLLKHNVLPM